MCREYEFFKMNSYMKASCYIDPLVNVGIKTQKFIRGRIVEKVLRKLYGYVTVSPNKNLFKIRLLLALGYQWNLAISRRQDPNSSRRSEDHPNRIVEFPQPPVLSAIRNSIQTPHFHRAKPLTQPYVGDVSHRNRPTGYLSVKRKN